MTSAPARLVYGLVSTILACGVALSSAQTPPPPRPGTGSAIPKPPTASRSRSAAPPIPSRIERTDDKRLRVGSIEVDVLKKELTVPGVVNETPVLEFLVNTKNGYKSYESAIEADCNGVDFNLGLTLIGLDRDRTTARPRFHFDPIPPQGDPLEIWVSWKVGTDTRRASADELMYDITTNKAVPTGTWVYTGSQFVPRTTAFLADVDGVLIGFVHTPAPLIERVDPVPGSFGNIKINPLLGLRPGMPVTVTVRALPRAAK